MRQIAAMARRIVSRGMPLAALLALGALTACHRPPPDPLADCRALLDLPKRNPAADADTAAGKGDLRVLMLGGFTPVVPGVPFEVTTVPRKIGTIAPNGNGSRLIGARMVRGTSDLETRECLALRPTTLRYAFAYNRRMLTHLPPPGP
jgi:hypothetical protein